MDVNDYTKAELATEARRMAGELRRAVGVTTRESSYRWSLRVTNRGATLVVTLEVAVAGAISCHVQTLAL